VAEYSTDLAATPRTSYLTTDHLGSPRVVTDQLGTVVSRHDYTGFGKDIAETLGATTGGRTSAHGYGATDELRKQYTGYERDEESGLEYAQARYYNGDHGRFTSTDPLMASADIKNPQTFNRYSYVLNSPYKYVDPLGLISSSTGACGNFCRGYDGGSTAFYENSNSGWVNGIDTYTLAVNIVYDQNQYSEEQAKTAMADTVKDLESTYKPIGIKFKITYTAGSRDAGEKSDWGGATRVDAKYSREKAINVFLFATGKDHGGQSGSEYVWDSKQIMLWEGSMDQNPAAKNVATKLSSSALAHEMSHLFFDFAGYPQGTGILGNTLTDAEIGVTLTNLRYNPLFKPRPPLPIDYKYRPPGIVGSATAPTLEQLLQLGARRVLKSW